MSQTTGAKHSVTRMQYHATSDKEALKKFKVKPWQGKYWRGGGGNYWRDGSPRGARLEEIITYMYSCVCTNWHLYWKLLGWNSWISLNGRRNHCSVWNGAIVEGWIICKKTKETVYINNLHFQKGILLITNTWCLSEPIQPLSRN